MGIPCSDALLSLGYDSKIALTGPIEETQIGTLFIVPTCPFKGKDFMNITQHISDIFQKYSFEPYMTFNLIDHINTKIHMHGLIAQNKLKLL